MFDSYGHYIEKTKKTPLDRKMITGMLWKEQRWSMLISLILSLMLVGVGLLGFVVDDWTGDILAWFFLISAALMVVEELTVFILLLLRKFSVSLDAMCRKEIVHHRSGNHVRTYHKFYFSHHGSFTTGRTLYSYSEPGQLFYVVSFAGQKWAPAIVFHTHMYEWAGSPEELGGVVPTVEDDGEARTESTIFSRRPLTKGRKTRLTDEEITRDLLENRRISDELFAKLSAGLLVICGALFFANVEAASIVLAVVGAAWVLWLAVRLRDKRQVQKHRFIITEDTLMDKDPVTRGVLRWKKMHFVFSFRQSGTYRLPRADESVYYDAELGDTFLVVRLEGKSRAIRAVYNTLDYDWD